MGRGKTASARQSNEPSTATSTGTAANDDPIFFYMPDAQYGEFCQWFPSTFQVSRQAIAELMGRSMPTDDDLGTTITFGCAEQFMMYCKAEYFNDGARQTQILMTDSPKRQKALGKLTVGFNEADWGEVKFQVVEAGNMAKFGQNRHMRGRLLSTGDRLLCEASSKDRVWGIGYTAKHAMQFRQHWGQNLLGKALMSVREKLRDCHGDNEEDAVDALLEDA